MAAHSTRTCGDSEPLLVILELQPVVGECHLLSNEKEVDRAICVEREVELSRRSESDERRGVPAGLSMYPQANGSCDEAWVPRMSRFTAGSIDSVGWFCMSPENRRHNPSEICCCEAIVIYPSPACPWCRTRGNRRSAIGRPVGKMDVIPRRWSVRRST